MTLIIIKLSVNTGIYETIDINNSTSETNHNINIEMHSCSAYGFVKEERMEQNTACEISQANLYDSTCM